MNTGKVIEHSYIIYVDDKRYGYVSATNPQQAVHRAKVVLMEAKKKVDFTVRVAAQKGNK